jgi:hypothetical protein
MVWAFAMHSLLSEARRDGFQMQYKHFPQAGLVLRSIIFCGGSNFQTDAKSPVLAHGPALENLLLPFELPSEMKAAMKYRWAILPGSKRYNTNAGEVIGDNTDVRPPSAGEIWQGGVVSGFGVGHMEAQASRSAQHFDGRYAFR